LNANLKIRGCDDKGKGMGAFFLNILLKLGFGFGFHLAHF
jgi:hypothetical protein